MYERVDRVELSDQSIELEGAGIKYLILAVMVIIEDRDTEEPRDLVDGVFSMVRCFTGIGGGDDCEDTFHDTIDMTFIGFKDGAFVEYLFSFF